MTNAQIISLKNRLRSHFDMERVLETFSDEVWENNNYGEAYENLTEEKFIKYFAEAMLNPTKEEEVMDDEEEMPMCVECGLQRCVDADDEICHTCYHKTCEEGECYCQVNMDEDDDDDVKCEECWTCEGKATNQVWRDALNEYEHTCDACHRNEYPEEYENEE